MTAIAATGTRCWRGIIAEHVILQAWNCISGKKAGASSLPSPGQAVLRRSFSIQETLPRSAAIPASPFRVTEAAA